MRAIRGVSKNGINLQIEGQERRCRKKSMEKEIPSLSHRGRRARPVGVRRRHRGRYGGRERGEANELILVRLRIAACSDGALVDALLEGVIRPTVILVILATAVLVGVGRNDDARREGTVSLGVERQEIGGDALGYQFGDADRVQFRRAREGVGLLTVLAHAAGAIAEALGAVRGTDEFLVLFPGGVLQATEGGRTLVPLRRRA